MAGPYMMACVLQAIGRFRSQYAWDGQLVIDVPQSWGTYLQQEYAPGVFPGLTVERRILMIDKVEAVCLASVPECVATPVTLPGS
jgi:hypothetical protein